MQREFLERAILALTLTTVQKLDTEETTNYNLLPLPHSFTYSIYFNVNNIKINVTRKGNSSWQRRVYIKQVVGVHLEYCILHICWLFILHLTHTHTHTPSPLCMRDREVLQESNDLACKEGIKQLLRWTEGTDTAQDPKGNKNRGKRR